MTVSLLDRAVGWVSRRLPPGQPGRHGIRVQRDVAYGPHDRQRYDLFEPPDHGGRLVVYVHGGGFRVFSKDTHWLFASAIARAGHRVANIDYRLAPEAPAPAAANDVLAAIRQVVAQESVDPARLAFAGDSAGANLVTVATIRAIQGELPRPAAVIAACPFLEVDGAVTVNRRQPVPPWVQRRLRSIRRDYLGPAPERLPEDVRAPLAALAEVPCRELPAFLVVTAGRDPLLDDGVRLVEVLRGRGGEVLHDHADGEIHCYHALPHRSAARACWRRQLAFLDRHLTDRRDS